MAHPEHHVDPDILEGVRAIALGLPGATERRSVGNATFGTKKLFCWISGVERGATHIRYPRSILVLLDEDDRRAVLDAGGYVPAYSGPSGWVGVHIDEVGWDAAAELIEESYRRTAPANLVAELDARSASD